MLLVYENYADKEMMLHQNASEKMLIEGYLTLHWQEAFILL